MPASFYFNKDEFNKKLDRKYDILQQHADIEGREQVAKAPYYASAATENIAKAGIYPSMAQENIAKANLYPSMATENTAKAGYYDTGSAENISKTGIAKQKWEGFEKPAMTNMQDMFNENFDIMKSNKKKSLALEGRAYDSPEFAQRTYGLTPPTSSPLAVAKPKARPSWYTGKQTTPFEEEGKMPMFAPWGGGESNPVNWALQPAVPFMRMFR